MSSKRDQKDWEEICMEYCKRIGADFLFANVDNGDFGYELDGELVHLNYRELMERLVGEEEAKKILNK